MLSLSKNAERALDIIKSNPRDLLPSGHAVLNSGIKELLAKGAVVYANSNTGYKAI